MVYFSDIYSIIECIYLSESLGEKVGQCDIFINPDSISYIVGKTVIINKVGYPDSNIEGLLSNRCKVISRVYIEELRDHLLYQPYILTPNFNIMWNGISIDSMTDLLKNCIFDKDELKLYFPKIKLRSFREDERGNLTAIGWALHQVGVNIKDSPFKDLDVIKTKKMLF